MRVIIELQASGVGVGEDLNKGGGFICIFIYVHIVNEDKGIEFQ